MNLLSTSDTNVDPDYVLKSEPATVHLNVSETDEWIKHSKTIINREFKRELDTREKQLDLIQKRIVKTCKMLHLIRYVLVSSYYNNSETVLQEIEEETYQLPNAQERLHPAIKKLLGGDQNLQILNKKRHTNKPIVKQETEDQSLKPFVEINVQEESSKLRLQECVKDVENSQKAASILRNRVLTKHVIIVGNISKYIPSKNPNDKLVHKWMVYVRGSKVNPNISGFVHKVVFYLHPSYKPNDIVDVDEYPFHLTRRGWGEFPLRAKIYFKNNFNKPVDIIHNLRLDKTYVGRQTLGSETVVEVNLCDATETSNYFETIEHFPSNKRIKIEVDDASNEIPDYLLSNEQLDTNSFFINSIDIKQEIAQSIIAEESQTTNIDVDFDNMFQRFVDSDHSYSRYTILNGIKRKIDHIPIRNCNTKIKFTDAEEQSNCCVTIYDMNRLRSTIQMITFLLRKMPLVTNLAGDSNYKSTFPYSAMNLWEFNSWNVAKRQASEWSRARMIRNAIISSYLPNCTNWSTKKIVLFARAYGFTPTPMYKPFNKIIYEEHLVDLKAPNRPRIESPTKSDCCFQVDITNNSISDLQVNGFAKPKLVLIDALTAKYDGFVKEAAFEMGVILREDEIIPGVCYNTSETLLLKAVMCFADDLLRCARADAVYKGQLQCDKGRIESENVINALSTYRNEFSHVSSFNKYTKLF